LKGEIENLGAWRRRSNGAAHESAADNSDVEFAFNHRSIRERWRTAIMTRRRRSRFWIEHDGVRNMQPPSRCARRRDSNLARMVAHQAPGRATMSSLPLGSKAGNACGFVMRTGAAHVPSFWRYVKIDGPRAESARHLAIEGRELLSQSKFSGSKRSSGAL